MRNKGPDNTFRHGLSLVPMAFLALSEMGIQDLLKACDFELLSYLDNFDNSYPKIIMSVFAQNTVND